MDERREIWWPSPTTELAEVVAIESHLPFVARHGGCLAELQFSFESWGRLSAAGDNAVLIVHPMTADCHARSAGEGQMPGWWEPLIGPGRVLDTDRYFVVCPNLLGGCYGTTGPRFPRPDDPEGRPWLDHFPLLTPLDMVRSSRLFLEAIGVRRLEMVIGPSMGGMVAWEWAVEAGEEVGQVVVVAAPLRTTPYQIGLNWLQRRGIELDISGDEVIARWGQMVARGIGMLSYRSPVGMEEKFGRDWFKKPGRTLAERGMFNVESWLRHHGKKITRRFDPYTWLLYSRAMDLHDVAEGREGLLGALDRVAARCLVVGISSDNLYSAAEVRLGADILRHLGKRVEYAEIRSPHGHDAFLLETAQLEGILAGARPPQPVVVPATPGREVRHVRLALLGGGRVAQSLLGVLEERARWLADEHGLHFEIVEICDLDADKDFAPAVRRHRLSHDPEALVRRADFDVLVELTRGGDVAQVVAEALAAGRPVVTPNKMLIHDHGARLEALAVEHGVPLAYHSSIAAGWPLLYAVERPLRQADVHTLKAIVSSTCNLVLGRIEEGDDLEGALVEAQRLGLPEEDPHLDLSGWDTAQKMALLITRALGRRYGADDLPTMGIEDLDPQLVRAAPAAGFRIKAVGLCHWGGGRPVACVRPMAVTTDGHLGSVRGEGNAVVLVGDELGEMVHIGKGSGVLPVATALINDLVGLFDTRVSWTGRFDPAGQPPRAPDFAHWLMLRDGKAVVGEAGGEGAIPVLRSLLHPRPEPTSLEA
ncbi:MAG: homoserine O-acetyltransferase [Acidobacteriota bacterium]|nr:homoserine O-acetyltransferase [Acidobacteriota bacterium]MDQ7088645.1 homoserine O-acetyltransferase [Acidobacteriota bacterium]